jgi:3-hydroxybutyrate dehydrogenase
MSDEEFDLAAPELTPEEFLTLPDDRFTTENVALVTGAASGIGQATAVVLAANGLTVVGTDVDEDGLAETAAIAEECAVPGSFTHVVGDLTDDGDIERIVESAAEEGRLRYLANIAGLQHIAPIPEFPTEKYDLLQSVMLRAPFLLAKHVVPHVRATDDGVGAIANMSSVHGHYATKDKVAYITMKHGLMGLTRSIAAEGEGSLRSFSVSAGYVLTPLMVNQIEETAAERGISEREVVEDVMLGQARTKTMMAPVDVANLFAFGFSEFGRHLNGADLLWDGGYVHTYE